MENYIGKICPFCKTEIAEADAVKVCPACGIPHHEGCWEENHGCTTFGCAEQHYEAQHTNPTAVCTNCGAPLGDGQAFCPKCGTPKAAAPQKHVCAQCGTELQEGQAFCPKCGYKADLAMDTGVNAAINQFNAGVTKANEAQKKKPVLIAIIAAAVVAVIALCVLVGPKLFVSVEDLCAQGNYEKAYEKAEGAEKEDVIAENNIAVCSGKAVKSLKDSKSFDLRDAWYDPENGYVVLKIAANNSYGNTVINYWLYTYDHTNDHRWECWEAYANFDKKQTSKYDTTDELIEKLAYNVGINLIQIAMTDSNKLSSAGVKRINNLFTQEMLDLVDHMQVAIPEKKED